VQGLNSIEVSFDAAQSAIAVDFPGVIRFSLYRDNELIGLSSKFISNDPGRFAGITSSIPFDSVEISATAGLIAIDDLHFARIPAPNSILPLSVLVVYRSRNRRRRMAGRASVRLRNRLIPRSAFVVIALVVGAIATTAALAELTEFGNEERDAWFDAASGGGGDSNLTTIGFTGYSDGTLITDQYSDRGITFTDGDDFAAGPSSNAFPQDDWGLDGSGDITVEFSDPQNAVAVDFPGDVRFILYRDDELLGASSKFIAGGAGNFAGIVSNEYFDSVVIEDPAGFFVFIDDLHFVSIPAPAVLPGLLTGALLFRSRRRTPR